MDASGQHALFLALQRSTGCVHAQLTVVHTFVLLAIYSLLI